MQTPPLPGLDFDSAVPTRSETELLTGLADPDDLPIAGASHRRLLEVASNPRSSSQDLVDVLALDPSLAARALRLANRIQESPAQPIASLARAVLRLGPRQVGQLALGGPVWRSQSDGPDVALNFLWHHSVHVAVLARRLARLLGADAELAFSGGLLHDIGRIALLSRHPGDESDLLDGTTPETLAREQERYGADHTGIGRSLASGWGLPAPLVELIGDHHRTIGPNEAATPLGAIRLAHHLLGQVEEGCPDGPTFDLEFAAMIDILTRPGRSLPHLGALVRHPETRGSAIGARLVEDR